MGKQYLICGYMGYKCKAGMYSSGLTSKVHHVKWLINVPIVICDYFLQAT